jgi:hypothetical protein
VKDVSLESKVNEIIAEMEDPGKVQGAIAAFNLSWQDCRVKSIHSGVDSRSCLEPVAIHSLRFRIKKLVQ